jgi:hypothetical protein
MKFISTFSPELKKLSVVLNVFALEFFSETFTIKVWIPYLL